MSDLPIEGDIEFLDVVEPDTPASEVVTAPGSRRNGLAIAAALAVGALGIAALASAGSDDAAPPTTTSPPTTAPAPPSTTIDRPTNASPSAVIGDGPDIVWTQVSDDIDATTFEWVENSFFGSGGTIDVFIEPLLDGAFDVSFVEADDLTDRSVRSSSDVIRVADDPLTLMFSDIDSVDVVTVAPIGQPSSDLVTASTTVAAERIGDLVLVLQSTATFLEVETFRERVGTEMDPIFGVSLEQAVLTLSGDGRDEVIPVAELDLSVDDLAALQDLGEPMQVLSIGTIGSEAELVDSPMSRIDWIAAIDDEFTAGGDQLWRSPDGVQWEQSGGDTPRFGGLNAPGPDGVLSGLAFEGDAGFLTMSTDAGRSWNRLARPFENTWTIDSAFPIVAMTGWQDEPSVPRSGEWIVLSPRFELRINGEEGTFELLDREGSRILSGLSSDPTSGFRFIPGSTDVWFVDPATGEEVARFPQSMFASAFAATRSLDGQPQLVAFANLMGSQTVEWSLARVTELFGPDALAVDITPGPGWFLADVTTTTGRELYLAEMPVTAVRSLSERRHPTHGDMARADND